MTDLQAVRSWYAEELRYASAVKSPAVVRAFARTVSHVSGAAFQPAS